MTAEAARTASTNVNVDDRTAQDAYLDATYRAEAAALRGRLLALTRNTAVADDLVAATFVRLVAQVRAGEPPEDPGAWLYRVGYNLAISGGRRQVVATRALPGLVDLLDAFDSACVPIALATSAPAENVEHTLRELGLVARLTRVVRSDQVARGKPHPDVFLAAAAALRVRPERCLAFEDAPMGVLAARAAGMHTVAVTTTFSPAAFAAEGAQPHEYVADFAEYLKRRRVGV